MLKLTHKFTVMVDSVMPVDSTVDSVMPDMPTTPLLPSPSPPPSPRPSRLPALRSLPNIALMSQSSQRSSPPSRLATLSPRSSAHPPTMGCSTISVTPASQVTLGMEWTAGVQTTSATIGTSTQCSVETSVQGVSMVLVTGAGRATATGAWWAYPAYPSPWWSPP